VNGPDEEFNRQDAKSAKRRTEKRNDKERIAREKETPQAIDPT